MEKFEYLILVIPDLMNETHTEPFTSRIQEFRFNFLNLSTGSCSIVYFLEELFTFLTFYLATNLNSSTVMTKIKASLCCLLGFSLIVCLIYVV